MGVFIPDGGRIEYLKKNLMMCGKDSKPLSSDLVKFVYNFRTEVVWLHLLYRSPEYYDEVVSTET